MSGKRYQGKEWPYGLPVIVCPRCQGTGSDRAKLLAAICHSRAPVTDLEGLKCAACEGRGRILVRDAGAAIEARR